MLFALSLCADCFAVSLCSSVTLKKVTVRKIVVVSLCFAIIQTGLLLFGWAFGYLVLGLVEKIAKWIGFLLLLYVGGSMFLSGLKGDSEVRNLDGLGNVILGGVATSIDALGAGASLSMASVDWKALVPMAVAVFVCTVLSVVLGMWGGSKFGPRVGPVVEIIGGCALIGIGIGFLI